MRSRLEMMENKDADIISPQNIPEGSISPSSSNDDSENGENTTNINVPESSIRSLRGASTIKVKNVSYRSDPDSFIIPRSRRGKGITKEKKVSKMSHDERNKMREKDALARKQRAKLDLILRPVDLTLLNAAYLCDKKTVRDSLQNGANINACYEDRITALHLAAERGDVELLKIILGHPEVTLNTRSAYGYTALYLAARSGHDKASEMLLKRGAFSGKSDQMGRTPLHAAVYNGHLNCAIALVKNGANVNTADAFHEYPLHIATTRQPQPKMAHMLIRHGATTKKQINAILLDVVLNSTMPHAIRIVTMLFRLAKANVNSYDIVGRTALHLTALTGDVEMAKCLLAQGADPERKCLAGYTALEMANFHSNYGIIHLLKPVKEKLDAIRSEELERYEERQKAYKDADIVTQTYISENYKSVKSRKQFVNLSTDTTSCC